MEQSKTISGLICKLIKEGYTINIEEFNSYNGAKCRIKVSKDNSSWTRIVPYELLEKDSFLMYILELLKKSIEQLEYCADRNVAIKTASFMEGDDPIRDENG